MPLRNQLPQLLPHFTTSQKTGKGERLKSFILCTIFVYRFCCCKHNEKPNNVRCKVSRWPISVNIHNFYLSLINFYVSLKYILLIWHGLKNEDSRLIYPQIILELALGILVGEFILSLEMKQRQADQYFDRDWMGTSGPGCSTAQHYSIIS